LHNAASGGIARALSAGGYLPVKTGIFVKEFPQAPICTTLTDKTLYETRIQSLFRNRRFAARHELPDHQNSVERYDP
jgi:hypothetical protein